MQHLDREMLSVPMELVFNIQIFARYLSLSHAHARRELHGIPTVIGNYNYVNCFGYISIYKLCITYMGEAALLKMESSEKWFCDSFS